MDCEQTPKTASSSTQNLRLIGHVLRQLEDLVVGYADLRLHVVPSALMLEALLDLFLGSLWGTHTTVRQSQTLCRLPDQWGRSVLLLVHLSEVTAADDLQARSTWPAHQQLPPNTDSCWAHQRFRFVHFSARPGQHEESPNSALSPTAVGCSPCLCNYHGPEAVHEVAGTEQATERFRSGVYSDRDRRCGVWGAHGYS